MQNMISDSLTNLLVYQYYIFDAHLYKAGLRPPITVSNAQSHQKFNQCPSVTKGICNDILLGALIRGISENFGGLDKLHLAMTTRELPSKFKCYNIDALFARVKRVKKIATEACTAFHSTQSKFFSSQCPLRFSEEYANYIMNW